MNEEAEDKEKEKLEKIKRCNGRNSWNTQAGT